MRALSDVSGAGPTHGVVRLGPFRSGWRRASVGLALIGVAAPFLYGALRSDAERWWILLLLGAGLGLGGLVTVVVSLEWYVITVDPTRELLHIARVVGWVRQWQETWPLGEIEGLQVEQRSEHRERMAKEGTYSELTTVYRIALLAPGRHHPLTSSYHEGQWMHERTAAALRALLDCSSGGTE